MKFQAFNRGNSSSNGDFELPHWGYLCALLLALNTVENIIADKMLVCSESLTSVRISQTP